jgi:pyruvate dehydrogenase E1 component
MLEQQKDEFYYITVMNEKYPQPSKPTGVDSAIVKGMYRCAAFRPEGQTVPTVHLLGSGAILREVLMAGELLATDWHLASEVYSVTSFSELAHDAAEVQRWNRLHPLETPRIHHIEQQLHQARVTVAATDYVRSYPLLIAPHLEGLYIVLGTDGFGRSDTRETLRRFFEVDCYSVVLAALDGLAQSGLVRRQVVDRAISRYGLERTKSPPWAE